MDQDITISEENNGVHVVVDWIVEFSCWRLTLDDSDDVIGPAASVALDAAGFTESAMVFYPFHSFGMYFSRPGDYNTINGEVGLRVPPEEGSETTTEWNPRTIFEYAASIINLDTPPTDDIPV